MSSQTQSSAKEKKSSSLLGNSLFRNRNVRNRNVSEPPDEEGDKRAGHSGLDPTTATMPAASSLLISPSSFRTFQLDTPARRWLSSFGRSDPRYQILQHFDAVANTGGRHITSHEESATVTSCLFDQASVFSVWRPTSAIAIRRMIAGEATGKGLEIKGKSAKAGKLSGYVPYLQIWEEPHKRKVKTLSRKGRVRIFYKTQAHRNGVMEELEPLQNQIVNAVHDAKRVVFKPIGKGISKAGSHVASATSELKSSLSQVATDLSGNLRDNTSPIMSGIKRFGSATKKSDEETKSSDGKRDREISAFSLKGLRNSLSHSRSGGSSHQESDDDTSNRDAKRPSLKGLRASFPGNTNEGHKGQNDEDEQEWALKRLLWDMDDPSIRVVDDYAPLCYGIELPDRLLWKIVMDSDISRPDGSAYYTARPSQPAFQDMNFNAIFNTRKHGRKRDDGPRVVLWQACGSYLPKEDPMDPRGLIMAYEENGRVLPVVSDFDCFTVGTRGVSYQEPLPPEQFELLKWCVTNVESVLDKQNAQASSKSRTWTSCWLDVLKSSTSKGFHPDIPRFGFGDEKSYAITEYIVSQLHGTGAVRHGAECFNYYFPQELDEEFLIVCNVLPGKVPWKYVGVQELQRFLLQKVDDGYTFPLNPKWMLCDDGWMAVYNRLLKSDRANVQDSLDIWMPRVVRGLMESIHEKHPQGFVCEQTVRVDGTEAMDMAMLELDEYITLRRAKVKLRVIFAFIHLLESVRNKRNEKDLRAESSSGDYDHTL